MKKLMFSMCALAAATAASASAPWNLGGVIYEADTLYHYTSGPGVTSTGIRLINPNNETNIHYSEIDLTNPALELRGVQGKDVLQGMETVKSMGTRKDAQGNGQYIAGVNSDFFSSGGSTGSPCGNAIIEGTLYNQGWDSGWLNWATYATVEGAKDIRLLQGVNVRRVMNFPNGDVHNFYVDPAGRWDNWLNIYTPGRKDADGNPITTTGTNVWGIECTAKIISGALATTDAVIQITGECVGGDASGNPAYGNMAIPEDGIVLSGVGDAIPMMKNLKVGDIVKLGPLVSHNGTTINPNHLVGGCSQIVVGGDIAPDDYFSASVVDHFTSNQARTCMGYNADRTKLIMLVADKYTASQLTTSDAMKQTYGPKSSGMILKRMGYIMKHLGCYTAHNFDGGGSSQLFNKGMGILNAPYGGDYLRPVSNGFFAVSTTPVDNTVAQLEVRQKDVKLSAGQTFTPVVYGYNKYGVMVNNNVKGFTLTVAPSMGSVSGTTFTAGSAAACTRAVVEAAGVKCAVSIATNGGGAYVTSGDDNAPVYVAFGYTPDEPMGYDAEPYFLTAQWVFNNAEYNDKWTSAAPNWASEDAIKATPCPRFATGINGNFYTVDMTTMSIAQIDKAGNFTPKYKLPSLADKKVGTKADFYGTAITTDDAGNFLIGHLFVQPESFRVWTVYSPVTGKAKHFEVTLPDGEKSNGRIDNIGRVVGDLTKDAYVYIAPKATGTEASQKPLILHYTGDGNVDNIELASQMGTRILLSGSGNTTSTMQPRYEYVEDMAGLDLDETYYWYSKTVGVTDKSVNLYTKDNGKDSPNYGLLFPNHSALNGFDTFVMDGRRLFVVAYSTEAELSTNSHGQHIAVVDENGKLLAEWKESKYTSKAGYNTITARPVSDSQVDIYVYNCSGKANGSDTAGAIAGALLSLTYGGRAYTPTESSDPTTGVEDLTTAPIDDNAPAVYYNLQGIQVKNPANGIYIVRRGNTTEKVLVK